MKPLLSWIFATAFTWIGFWPLLRCSAAETGMMRALSIDSKTADRLKSASNNLSRLPAWAELPQTIQKESVEWQLEELSMWRTNRGFLRTSFTSPETTLQWRLKADLYEGGVKALAGELGSAVLQNTAGEVVEANRFCQRWIETGSFTTQDPSRIRKIVSVLDRTSVRMFKELRERQEQFVKESPMLSPLRRAERERQLRLTEGKIAELLTKAEQVDHSQFDNLRMLPSSVLRQIVTNFNLVAAVGWKSSPNQPAQFLGSGFVYRGHVITCAHLFTSFWDPGRRNFTNVVVFPYSPTDDGFTTAAPIQVKPEGCELFPEFDVACLELANTPASQQLLKQAAMAQIAVTSNAPVLSSGVVYALAAKKESDGTLKTKWIPPSRILFSYQMRLPRRLNPQNALTCANVNFSDEELDDRFLRAIRIQLFAHGCGVGGTEAFCDAVKAIGLRYVMPGVQEISSLAFPFELQSNLDAFSGDTDFKRSKLIAAVGTDLPSEPGASGAPVFHLTSDRIVPLIGMNRGIVGGLNNIPTAASLDNCTRVLPIHLAIPKIDSFISKKPTTP